MMIVICARHNIGSVPVCPTCYGEKNAEVAHLRQENKELANKVDAYREVAFEAVRDDFDHSWEAEDWVYQKAQEIMAARK